MSQWSIYLIRCRLGRLYTGISTDVERRLQEHRSGRRGARSLKGKGPLALEFCAPVGDRSCALKAEARIKRLGKADKERLVAGALSLADLLN